LPRGIACVVDAADYIVWRNLLGQTGVTPYSSADGNGNGMIDQGDYGVWRAHFGQTLPSPGAGSGSPAIAFSQVAYEVVGNVVVPARAEATATSVGATPEAASRVGLAKLDARSVPHNSASRPRKWVSISGVAESTADNLLLMLAIDRVGSFVPQDFIGSDGSGRDQHPADETDTHYPINRPLAAALADWP
jgi:hypothetical protein